eukprot:PhF_6_TR24815/c1_g1_i1/m.34161
MSLVLVLVTFLVGCAVAQPDACANPRLSPYQGPTNMYSFGLNWGGQLGYENNRSYEPQRFFVGSFSNVAISRLRGGFQHTIAMDDITSTAFSAGRAADGALGLGPQVTTFTVPTFNQIVEVVENVYPESIRTSQVIDVCAGWYHSCMVISRPSGKNVIFCSGKNDQGQLGNVDVKTSISTMLKVNGGAEFQSKSFINITCGADHTVAKASDGTLWSWGNGEEGQLGNGGTSSSQTAVKVTVPTGVNVDYVSCGYRFCVLRTTGGAVYGWGYNKLYQLSDGVTGDRATSPTLIIDSGVNLISAGGYHVLAIIGSKVYSWGLGTLGQTAQPKPFAEAVKKQWNAKKVSMIPSFVNTNIQDVSAGIKHSLVLDTCGNVYAFGSDAFGQLGVGYLGMDSTFRSMTPIKIPRVAAWQLDVARVSAVGYHSFIIAKKTS